MYKKSYQSRIVMGGRSIEAPAAFGTTSLEKIAISHSKKIQRSPEMIKVVTSEMTKMRANRLTLAYWPLIKGDGS